jgi:IS30 family transposase
MGARNRSVIGTLVERVTRFVILVHVPTRRPTAQAMRDGVTDALGALPAHLRRTLTWDQGKELALHQQITACIGTRVFFCDAHSPWQRGSNENTYWCTVLGPDGFDGSQSGGLLGDSENTCRTWLSVDLSTAA